MRILWNEDIINTYFSYRDALTILSLTLSQQTNHDNLFGNFDMRGEFSIKNAYKVAWQAHLSHQIEKNVKGYERYGTTESYVN